VGEYSTLQIRNNDYRDMSGFKGEGSGALLLPKTLDVYHVGDIRRDLLSYLSCHSDWIIDLGAVQVCDTAGAQLLCSLQQTAAQSGNSLRFDNIPCAVEQAWATLGLPMDPQPASAISNT
jgi:anti-anti-sigma regulatory factor